MREKMICLVVLFVFFSFVTIQINVVIAPLVTEKSFNKTAYGSLDLYTYVETEYQNISYYFDYPDHEDSMINITIDTGRRHAIISGQPLNFYNDSSQNWQPINNKIVNTTEPLYDYEVKSGIYHTFFKENPSTAESIKFYFNESFVGVKNPKKSGFINFQPLSLNYRTQLDQVQQINTIQGVTGFPQNNVMIYPDAFGTGLNITYSYFSKSIKENLIVNQQSDLPDPEQYMIDGGNITLDIDFQLSWKDELSLFIDNQLWDKKTTTSGTLAEFKQNVSDIEWLNETDYHNITRLETVFVLNEPYIYANNSLANSSIYSFKKQGNKLYVILKTNYTFINNTIYPIIIDPSVSVITTASNIEDAYIDNLNPTSNFGSHGQLKMQHWSNTIQVASYIRFNLSNLLRNSESVSLAEFEVEADTINGLGTDNVHEVFDTLGWTESGLTWNNNPCAGLFNSSCNTTPEDSVYIPVTDADKRYNFTVVNMTNKVMNYTGAKFGILEFVMNTTTPIVSLGHFYESSENGISTDIPLLHLTYIENPPRVTVNSPANNTLANYFVVNISSNDTSADKNITAYVNIHNGTDWDLLGYWSLDGAKSGSGNVKDNSTYGHNGTINGALTCSIAGKFGQTCNWATSSLYIDMGDNPDFEFPDTNANFTLSAWVYAANSATNKVILAKRDSTFVEEYDININGAEKFCMTLTDDGSTDETICTNNAISINTWTHVLATAEVGTDTYKLYINGVAQATTGTPTITDLPQTAGNFVIGDVMGSRPLIGYIDEVYVFKRVLTQSEISALAGYSNPLSLATQNFTRQDNYTFYACSNDVGGSFNCTGNYYINVTEISNNGFISVNLTVPTGDRRINRNDSWNHFNVTINATCTGGSCGAITGKIQVNHTENGEPEVFISEYSNRKPFYIYGTNQTAKDDYFNFSTGLASDPTGIWKNSTNYLISADDDDAIYEYDLTGTATGKTIDVSGQGNAPQDVDNWTSSGTHYIAVLEDQNNAVLLYTNGGTYTDLFCAVGSQEASPTGMAIDNANEKLYVVGTAQDTVYRYTMATCTYDSWSFATGLTNPESLDFNGTHFVVCNTAHCYRYNSTGSYDNYNFPIITGADVLDIFSEHNETGTAYYLTENVLDRAFRWHDVLQGFNNRTCGTLEDGDYCEGNFTLVASGDIGTQWYIDGNFTSDTIDGNDTYNVKINITAQVNWNKTLSNIINTKRQENRTFSGNREEYNLIQFIDTSLREFTGIRFSMEIINFVDTSLRRLRGDRENYNLVQFIDTSIRQLRGNRENYNLLQFIDTGTGLSKRNRFFDDIFQFIDTGTRQLRGDRESYNLMQYVDTGTGLSERNRFSSDVIVKIDTSNRVLIGVRDRTDKMVFQRTNLRLLSTEQEGLYIIEFVDTGDRVLIAPRSYSDLFFFTDTSRRTTQRNTIFSDIIQFIDTSVREFSSERDSPDLIQFTNTGIRQLSGDRENNDIIKFIDNGRRIYIGTLHYDDRIVFKDLAEFLKIIGEAKLGNVYDSFKFTGNPDRTLVGVRQSIDEINFLDTLLRRGTLVDTISNIIKFIITPDRTLTAVRSNTDEINFIVTSRSEFRRGTSSVDLIQFTDVNDQELKRALEGKDVMIFYDTQTREFTGIITSPDLMKFIDTQIRQLSGDRINQDMLISVDDVTRTLIAPRDYVDRMLFIDTVKRTMQRNRLSEDSFVFTNYEDRTLVGVRTDTGIIVFNDIDTQQQTGSRVSSDKYVFIDTGTRTLIAVRPNTDLIQFEDDIKRVLTGTPFEHDKLVFTDTAIRQLKGSRIDTDRIVFIPVEDRTIVAVRTDTGLIVFSDIANNILTGVRSSTQLIIFSDGSIREFTGTREDLDRIIFKDTNFKSKIRNTLSSNILQFMGNDQDRTLTAVRYFDDIINFATFGIRQSKVTRQLSDIIRFVDTSLKTSQRQRSATDIFILVDVDDRTFIGVRQGNTIVAFTDTGIRQLKATPSFSDLIQFTDTSIRQAVLPREITSSFVFKELDKRRGTFVRPDTDRIIFNDVTNRNKQRALGTDDTFKASDTSSRTGIFVRPSNNRMKMLHAFIGRWHTTIGGPDPPTTPSTSPAGSGTSGGYEDLITVEQHKILLEDVIEQQEEKKLEMMKILFLVIFLIILIALAREEKKKKRFRKLLRKLRNWKSKSKKTKSKLTDLSTKHGLD